MKRRLNNLLTFWLNAPVVIREWLNNISFVFSALKMMSASMTKSFGMLLWLQTSNTFLLLLLLLLLLLFSKQKKQWLSAYKWSSLSYSLIKPSPKRKGEVWFGLSNCLDWSVEELRMCQLSCVAWQLWIPVVFVNRNLHVNGMDELLLFLGSNPDEVMMMLCFQQLCPEHIWMIFTHTTTW